MKKLIIFLLFIFALTTCKEKEIVNAEKWEKTQLNPNQSWFRADNSYYGLNDIQIKQDEIYFWTDYKFLRVDANERFIAERTFRTYGGLSYNVDMFAYEIKISNPASPFGFYRYLKLNPVNNPKDSLLFDIDYEINYPESFYTFRTNNWISSNNQILLCFWNTDNHENIFYLYNIELDEINNKFKGKTLNKKIILPSSEFSFIGSDLLISIGGAFYVTNSKTLRFDKEGNYTLIPHNFHSIYEYQNKLIAKSYREFYISEDNGLNWEKLSTKLPSNLNYLNVVNNQVFFNAYDYKKGVNVHYKFNPDLTEYKEINIEGLTDKDLNINYLYYFNNYYHWVNQDGIYKIRNL